jgi:hypothetical protein
MFDIQPANCRANHSGSAPRLDCAMPVRPPTLYRSCACR